MIKHSIKVCCDDCMHSMNSTKESAAILTASAPPMMPIQYIGSFHFMYINSCHHINPQWYTQMTADAINTATSATCNVIFITLLRTCPNLSCRPNGSSLSCYSATMHDWNTSQWRSKTCRPFFSPIRCLPSLVASCWFPFLHLSEYPCDSLCC